MPPGNIWIVGQKPDWYNGNFIPVKDRGNKFTNISNCIKVATESPDISDDFVLMNDDFFVVKKLDEVPTYHGGMLEDRIKEYVRLVPSSFYTVLLNKTYREVKRQKIHNIIDYDIHVPMIFNKEKLNSVIDLAPFPRTMYGNKFSIGGEKVTDVKVYSDLGLKSRSYDFENGDMPYISCEDDSFQELYDKLLKDMFPDKSSYED